MRRLHSGSLLLAVGVLLLAVTGCPKKTPDAKDSGTAVSPAPDFTLDFEDLAKESEKDPEGIYDKYEGKWLVVEGKVNDTVLDESGSVGVIMGGFRDAKPQPRLFYVNFRVLKDVDGKAANLTHGQKVKIKGEVDGGTASRSIDLTKAELLEIGPDPSIVISAEQLAKEYKADSKAARAKYHEKWLLLNGTVVEWQKGKFVDDFVFLEGFDENAAKPFRVEVGIRGNDKPFFEKLTKGEKVKIKGWVHGSTEAYVSVAYGRLIP